eukprot:TRINITY_DN55448_c0_g1_i1.p1 TRINITY_DN55448_c0_g1~~TRINITY_DN55448_c0_g1_i1.p1  ORF type:complete len:145 (-),score=38.56 TRINITY_DN55448_c0_g1_i1:23-457(-)
MLKAVKSAAKGAVAGALSGSPPDPDDLSPPDELAQALSIWARHSAKATAKGAQAAAYARAQAEVAESLAQKAAEKVKELAEEPCFRAQAKQLEALESPIAGVDVLQTPLQSSMPEALLIMLSARQSEANVKLNGRSMNNLRRFL